MRPATLALVFVSSGLAVGGCTVPEGNFAGTALGCEADEACPDGFACEGDVCGCVADGDEAEPDGGGGAEGSEVMGEGEPWVAETCDGADND